MTILPLLAKIAPAIFSVIDKFVDDKDLAVRLKHELSTQMATTEGTIARASADVVMTEVAGESWLQRNWRPMTMIWFMFLIGGYWFGFVPINMPTEIVSQLFTLVQIGMGGYIAGRTGEKVVQRLGPIMGKGQ